MRIDPLPGKKNVRTMVFSFDEKYAKYFSVLLVSLFEHADRSFQYDLIVLYDELPQETMERMRSMVPVGFSIRFFDAGSLAYELLGNQSDRFSSGKWVFSTFYDLLIPFLMPDYERVVYFDTDLVFRADPGELFEMPFDGSALIAVRDTYSPGRRMLPDHPFLAVQDAFIRRHLGDAYGARYFNGGVLVFDIPAIDMEEYRKRMDEALAFPALPSVDQDVQNYIFKDDVTLAPLRLNLQVSIFNQFSDHPEDEEAEAYRKAAEDPVVIHYTTHEKPWCYPECQMSGAFWESAERSPFYKEILLENIGRVRNEKKRTLKRFLYRAGTGILRWIRREPRPQETGQQRRLRILKEKRREYRKKVIGGKQH